MSNEILITRPDESEMCPLGEHVVKGHIRHCKSGSETWVDTHYRKNRGKKKIYLFENLLYIVTLNKLLFITAVVISNFSTSGWCLFEKVASATVIITKEQDYFQQLKLPNNVEIHISSMFPKSCFDKDGLSDRNECFPITELNLIKGAKKFNNTKAISTNKNWKDVFIYIVKIAPSSYFKDLNNDGYYEIALFPMLAGNAVPSTAYIYSVKDTALEYYGNGLLSWEYLKEADNEKFVFNIKKETK